MSAYHRNRYRQDPDYRARVLAAVKASHKRNSKDPKYVRIIYLRKRIYDLRERIERAMERVAKQERELMAAIKERDKLVERRKKKNDTRHVLASGCARTAADGRNAARSSS